MVIWIGLLGAGVQDGDLDRTFGNSAAPKDSARASDFWKQLFQDGDLDRTFGEQVFQDGDLDRTFGSRAAPKDSHRAAIWIALFGAGVSGWHSGSDFWEQVFHHADLDRTFGNSAAPKDSSRSSIWLEAGVPKW